jgi:hypothetical protein
MCLILVVNNQKFLMAIPTLMTISMAILMITTMATLMITTKNQMMMRFP